MSNISSVEIIPDGTVNQVMDSEESLEPGEVKTPPRYSNNMLQELNARTATIKEHQQSDQNDSSSKKDFTSETNCPSTTANDNNGAIVNNETKSLTTPVKVLKTVSQLEADFCGEKVRAILELDAKKRKELVEQRKVELERRKQSGELAAEQEMKLKAKKQRKLEKKLEKNAKKANAIFDGDTETDMDSITSNKTLDGGMNLTKNNKDHFHIGHIDNDVEKDDNVSDDNVLYSNNGHCDKRNPMLTGMAAGVLPPRMQKLHYPMVHPHMPAMPSFPLYRPTVPYKHGKNRYDYGVGPNNFWLRGGYGGACYRFPNYRPYHPRGHRFYSGRGKMNKYPKFSINREPHYTQMISDKHLFWTKSKPSISYAFNLQSRSEENSVEAPTLSLNETDKKKLDRDNKEIEQSSTTKHKSKHTSKIHLKKNKLKVKNEHSDSEDNTDFDKCNINEQEQSLKKNTESQKTECLNGIILQQNCSNNISGIAKEFNNIHESNSDKDVYIKENNKTEFNKKELIDDISFKKKNQINCDVSDITLCSEQKSEAQSEKVDISRFHLDDASEIVKENDAMIPLDKFCKDHNNANISDNPKQIVDEDKHSTMGKIVTGSCLKKTASPNKLSYKVLAPSILEVQQRIDKMLGDTDFDIDNIEEMKKTLIEKSRKHRSAKQSLRQKQMNSDDEENEQVNSEQHLNKNVIKEKKEERISKTITSEIIEKIGFSNDKESNSITKSDYDNENALHHKIKNQISIDIATDYNAFGNEITQLPSDDKSIKHLSDSNNGKNKHNEIKLYNEVCHTNLNHHYKDFQLDDFNGQKRKITGINSIFFDKREDDLHQNDNKKYKNNKESKLEMDDKCFKKDIKSKQSSRPVWTIGKPISFAASEFLFPEENDTTTEDEKEINVNRKENIKIIKDNELDDNTNSIETVDIHSSQSESSITTKGNVSPDTEDYMDNWENDDVDFEYQQKFKYIATISPLPTDRILDKFESLSSYINPSPPAELLEKQTENQFLQWDNDNKSDGMNLTPNEYAEINKTFLNADSTPKQSGVNTELFEMQDVYDQFVKNVEESGLELKLDQKFSETDNTNKINYTPTKTNEQSFDVFDLQGPTENFENQECFKMRTSISFSLKPSSKIKNTNCLSILSSSPQSSSSISPKSTPSTQPPPTIPLSLKLSSKNNLSPSASLATSTGNSLNNPEENISSLICLTKDKDVIKSNSKQNVALFSPQKTAKSPNLKIVSPLPDASKDFKKLKNLETNLNRIQMLRANYGSSDDLSDELHKIEMLLLKEKKIILQKYTKSSSLLSASSPSCDNELNNKINLSPSICADNLNASETIQKNENELLVRKSYETLPQTVINLPTNKVNEKVTKSFDLELKDNKIQNSENDFSIISITTLQQEGIDLDNEDDIYSTGNTTSLSNIQPNDESVHCKSSSKTNDFNKCKERDQRERNNERKHDHREHERKHDDYDYDHDNERNYDNDNDNEQERNRDYDYERDRDYDYERDRDYDYERDNEYEKSRFSKSYHSTNHRRYKSGYDANRSSLRYYRNSVSKARMRIRSRSRSISSETNRYYKNRRYPYNMNRNNMYNKNTFGYRKYGRSYVLSNLKRPPSPKWKRPIKRSRSPRSSRSPQPRKHYYSPNNRDSRSPLPFKPPSPPMSPKSENSDSTSQSTQRRPRSPHSPRLSHSPSPRSPRFLHSPMPLRYNSRRGRNKNLLNINCSGSNRYKREFAMSPTNSIGKYRCEQQNRGVMDTELTSSYYNNQPYDPSSTVGNYLYNNFNYCNEFGNTDYMHLGSNTSSYYPTPYIPPGTCDSVYYPYINSNVNHIPTNGLQTSQQLQQQEQSQQASSSHFSTNLINLKSNDQNLDSVNVLSYVTSQQYSSMTNASSSAIYDNNHNDNSAVIPKDIHNMSSTAVNVMPRFVKEVTKTTGMAVQKGNVLEIVPSNENIIYKDDINIHGQTTKITQFKLDTQVDYPSTKRYKNNNNNTTIMDNILSSNNISEGANETITSDCNVERKLARSILKRNNNSNTTQMPPIKLEKTKKRVKFTDGIRTNCDSEDEDRKAAIQSVRRKLLRLRKKYGVDMPLLYELPDIGVDEASMIDPMLANLPPPPPPPNDPPPHLPQPIYLKPPTPVPLLYFRYDNVVSSMYISPLKEAIPPRKFNPQCVPSSATTTMTPPSHQPNNPNIYKGGGGHNINMNAMHAHVAPPLRYSGSLGPANVGPMTAVPNSVGLQQTGHQPMRQFEIYSHPPPPTGRLITDDIICKKNITMTSDVLNGQRRHLLPPQTMVPPPIINPQRPPDVKVVPGVSASYGQIPVNHVSKNNLNISPIIGSYHDNFRHLPLPSVTSTATISTLQKNSQNILPVPSQHPLQSQPNSSFTQPILQQNYIQQHILSSETIGNLQCSSIQNA